jgi:hypothetical protein
MKKYLLLLFAFFALLPLWSQRYEAGIIGGMFSQSLQSESMHPGSRFNQSLGLFFSRTLSENISLRSGLRYARVKGYNVSGEAAGKGVIEFSLIAELNFMELNPVYKRFSPYLFLGSGVSFYPGPNNKEQKWRGRGSNAPGGETASIGRSFNIPAGAGVKWLIGKGSVLGFETGIYKSVVVHLKCSAESQSGIMIIKKNRILLYPSRYTTYVLS